MEVLLRTVEARSGIPFDANRTRVEAIQTPDPDEQAIDARVYFHGLVGDDNLRLRVKFDISPFEKIVLPLVHADLLHPFSDGDVCAAKVQAYSLEEVLAEKLRSWIQRTRARDLFDVARIIASGRVDPWLGLPGLGMHSTLSLPPMNEGKTIPSVSSEVRQRTASRRPA
jgi:hypothetical protein